MDFLSRWAHSPAACIHLKYQDFSGILIRYEKKTPRGIEREIPRRFTACWYILNHRECPSLPIGGENGDAVMSAIRNVDETT